MAADVVVKHHARVLNQPVMNAANARVAVEDTMNAKWYWPPLEGYADANSARPAAMERVS